MKTLFGLLVLVLDIVAIVDCIKGSLPKGKKILWIILIILLPVVGMILYFLLGKQK
ncbi:MAG: PLDc N-terminal domain-containing protein [Candidatus Ancaeobacter aquaticus]|nr:PLDc N-terminal domain-containing protein [Candidatus Ancaeobacter aquaticus]